jgi:RimJ/RimL family protein N-acetyltransferase
MADTVNVRGIREEDAEAFFHLNQALRTETEFLLLEQTEGPATPEAQAKSLRGLLASTAQTVWVAEENGVLVGFLGATRGNFTRNRHTAHFAMGVLRAWWGHGIGRRLLEALDEWAHARGVLRLEMTVVVDNARALALYERAGFRREGVRRGSLCVRDRLLDEFYMAKMLDPNERLAPDSSSKASHER